MSALKRRIVSCSRLYYSCTSILNLVYCKLSTNIPVRSCMIQLYELLRKVEDDARADGDLNTPPARCSSCFLTISITVFYMGSGV